MADLQKIKMGKLQIPDGKERVRPVKAVLMRWVVSGVTVDDILAERPNSIQEFVAQQLVKNVKDAVSGTRVCQQATEALRMMIDGLEEGQEGIRVPVTIIDRVMQDAAGELTQSREISKTVQLTFEKEEENGG